MDDKKSSHVESFFELLIGEVLGQALFCGLGAVGFWFLSKWWSAWVFLLISGGLMIGLPIFYHLRFKRKKERESNEITATEPISSIAVQGLMGGCLVGGMTIFFFPRTLFLYSFIEILIFIAGPLLFAYLAELISTRCREDDHNVKPRHHFWFAYWFTLAMLVIRFAYDHR